jgi:hypothetical protein
MASLAVCGGGKCWNQLEREKENEGLCREGSPAGRGKMEWEQPLEKWMGFCVVGWQRRRKWGNRLENERKWSAGWSGAAAVKGAAAALEEEED